MIALGRGSRRHATASLGGKGLALSRWSGITKALVVSAASGPTKGIVSVEDRPRGSAAARLAEPGVAGSRLRRSWHSRGRFARPAARAAVKVGRRPRPAGVLPRCKSPTVGRRFPSSGHEDALGRLRPVLIVPSGDPGQGIFLGKRRRRGRFGVGQGLCPSGASPLSSCRNAKARTGGRAVGSTDVRLGCASARTLVRLTAWGEGWESPRTSRRRRRRGVGPKGAGGPGIRGIIGGKN